MEYMVESFGEYLSRWMEENNHTSASLSLIMEKTSAATIARLMRDQLGYQRCAKFITELADAVGTIDESVLKAMRTCVEVNRYGKDLYIVQRDLMRLLHSEKAVSPTEEIENRLAEKILSWANGQKISILAMALTQSFSMRALRKVCEKLTDCEIMQLLENEQADQLFSMLNGGLALAFRNGYKLYTLNNASGLLVKNTLILKRADGQQMLILFHGQTEHILEVSKDNNLFDFCVSMIHADSPASYKINRLIRRNYPEEYAAFLEECFKNEENKAIYHLKSDVGLEYMPLDVLLRNFTEWARRNDVRFVPFARELGQLLGKRHENILKKESPTYLLMTCTGMLRFARTGEMVDHPFCLNPFSPEDRRVVIRHLIELAQTAPQFVPLFIKEENFRSDYSLIGYGDGKLLVFKSTANYDLSDYTEIIIDSQPLFEQYASFFSGILIKNHALGKKASIEFLKSLESEIPEK